MYSVALCARAFDTRTVRRHEITDGDRDMRSGDFFSSPDRVPFFRFFRDKFSDFFSLLRGFPAAAGCRTLRAMPGVRCCVRGFPGVFFSMRTRHVPLFDGD